jgi:CheY-like chemotaxis protein
VLTAASGDEALLVAADQSPEVILLDVMMPELDGPTTAQRLQDDERSREIPIILLTAKVQARDTARLGRVKGVRGIIAKPFDPMTLAQQVARILGW